ncbi:MAG TPA: sialidase family protein [Candidatus Bathyarchaeia archaeon]|nr:sialidase family protein [Candidatus Bathyarchaeia archaeon]
MKAVSRTTVLIILALFSMQLLAYPPARASTYEKTNAGIVNIQTTFPVRGGAFDTSEECIRNAAYNNHHSESWIVIDPTDHNHLVGVSKFFSNPQYYLFHNGAMVSRDGGRSWKNTIIQGFDCRSAPRNGWSDTTDPVVAFDSNGALYSAVLAFNLKYNSTGDAANCCPAAEVSVVRSTDGGFHWNLANQGLPLAFFPTSDVTPDKQWIAVDSNPHSPFRDRVYVGWTVIDSLGNAEIWFSVSSDKGEHFTTPIIISSDTPDGPNNTFVFLGTGPDGTLYSSYSSFPDPNSSLTHVWVLSSRDGGVTFTSPRLAASFLALTTFVLPNTTFRDGLPDNFAVDPASGHLFVAMEVDGGKGLDVQLTESRDGGGSWSGPVSVNDASTVDDGTDQFQPTIAASPDGIVAVTFYDRRLQCPSGDPNILTADFGRANFCINTSIQFYKDGPRGLESLGSNVRVSHATWDPQNPGSTTRQLPRPGGPRGSETFIGDYFGLALAEGKAYVLFASNYDQGRNAGNNQQQFLGIVSVPDHSGSENDSTSGSVYPGDSLR